jgi:plasmid stabilization system protein ParE
MAESKPYRVHPLAWQDVETADDWYFQRSPDASDLLIVAISEALDTICEAPLRWPKYLHGTRRFLLHRFPFSVIYLDEVDAVVIVAVAHNKRKPDYWKQRL